MTAAKYNAHATRMSRKMVGAFPDLCDIESATESKGTTGGDFRTWSAIYTNVPCRYTPASSWEQRDADKPKGQTLYNVAIPAVKPDGTVITVNGKYRLKILARGVQPVRYMTIDGTPSNEGISIAIKARHTES